MAYKQKAHWKEQTSAYSDCAACNGTGKVERKPGDVIGCNYCLRGRIKELEAANERLERENRLLKQMIEE